MSSSIHEEANFFRHMRDEAEPVSSEQYHKLYTAIADLILRSSRVLSFYANPRDPMIRRSYSPGLQPYPGDILEERGVTGWIDGVRLAAVSVFNEGSQVQELFGIEAKATVAPTARKRPEDFFVLSTGGDKHWITEETTFRPISPDDLDALAYDLSLVPTKRADA